MRTSTAACTFLLMAGLLGLRYVDCPSRTCAAAYTATALAQQSADESAAASAADSAAEASDTDTMHELRNTIALLVVLLAAGGAVIALAYLQRRRAEARREALKKDKADQRAAEITEADGETRADG